jgi:NAD(P)-dependent dehydrogenase (short-subunit alcohol dehydrogenase family)
VIEAADVSGQRAIATGAGSGSGSGSGIETAWALSSAGAEVVMAVWRLKSAVRVAAGIIRSTNNSKVSVRALDLSDQGSVRDSPMPGTTARKRRSRTVSITDDKQHRSAPHPLAR